MSSPSVQATITRAIGEEARGRQLRRSLAALLPELHYHLVLPQPDPLATLLDFVLEYVRAVPDALEAAARAGERGGFAEDVALLVRQATELFLSPEPPGTAGDLKHLLEQAFLAHRLMEEVSDYYRQRAHYRVLPLDMTEANLIVHHLLGEALAGRLEQRVSPIAQGHLMRLSHREWAPTGSVAGAAAGVPMRRLQAPEQVRLRVAVPRRALL